MKINKLHIKEFRSHKDTKIDLDRFNFVIGKNHSGKSSIAMAIEFLLTGRALPFTDSAGKGADELIRSGARELYVAGEFDKTLVSRTKSTKGHSIDIGGRSGELRTVQAKIYEKLGVTADVLTAVLNSGRFASGMNEKEQRELLAAILASDPPKVPDSILADMTNMRGKISPAPTSVAEIDEDYAYFFAERRDANRDLKALGVVEEPLLDKDDPNPDQVRQKLQERRNELSTKETAKARDEERHSSTITSNWRKRESLAELRCVAAGDILKDEEEASLQAIAGKRDELDKLTTEERRLSEELHDLHQGTAKDRSERLGALKSRIRSIEDRITEKRNQLDSFMEIKCPECPTCSREISDNDRGAIGIGMKCALTTLQEELDAIDLNIPEAEDPNAKKIFKKIEDIRKRINVLGDVAMAEEQLKRHRVAVVAESKFNREIDAIKDPPAFDATQYDDDIADLKARIAKGEEVLESVRDVEAKAIAYRTWLKKSEDLTDRIEVLNRLIEFLGPGGIKSEMVGDKIAPFSKLMNESLEHFGYEATFSLDPYRFIVRPQGATDNDGLSVKQLSESEKFRFGIAFQVALAKTTGLDFAVIDFADMLDKPSRNELTQLVLESDLEQVIVLCTSVDGAPAQVPNGVKFIEL